MKLIRFPLIWLTLQLQCTVRLATGGAVSLFGFTIDDGDRDVLAAVMAVISFERARRRYLVADIFVRILPGYNLAIRCVFQNLANAVLINSVHAAANTAADQNPQ